jgi:hypothetical protein
MWLSAVPRKVNPSIPVPLIPTANGFPMINPWTSLAPNAIIPFYLRNTAKPMASINSVPNARKSSSNPELKCI